MDANKTCENCGLIDDGTIGDYENTVSSCGQWADGACQEELCGTCFDNREPCCGGA